MGRGLRAILRGSESLRLGQYQGGQGGVAEDADSRTGRTWRRILAEVLGEAGEASHTSLYRSCYFFVQQGSKILIHKRLHHNILFILVTEFWGQPVNIVP